MDEHTPSVAASHVRRQARGQRRIASILDATEHVISEVGYEAATTNGIAAAAGMSPGSLYQFFPNKDAILHALVHRYRDQLRAVYTTTLTPETARLPLTQLIDRIIDGLVAFKVARPGFWPIFHGSETSSPLAAAARDLRQEIIDRFDALLALRVPTLPPDRRYLHATITVEVVRAVLPLALSVGSTDSGAVITELKALLLAYLEPVVGRDGILDT